MSVNALLKELLDAGFTPHPVHKGMLVSKKFKDTIVAASPASAKEAIKDMYAGGPGSGCRGPNCGRPALNKWVQHRSTATQAIARILGDHRSHSTEEIHRRVRRGSATLDRTRERLENIQRAGRRSRQWMVTNQTDSGGTSWRLSKPEGSSVSTTPTALLRQAVPAPVQTSPVATPAPITNTNPAHRNPVGFLKRDIPYETPSTLQEDGVRINQQDLDLFHQRFNMSPLGYKALMLKDVAPDLTRDFKMTINSGEVREGVAPTFQIQVNTNAFEQSRTFSFQNGIVGHSYWRMYGEYEGKDIGKQIFKNQLDLYDHLGMKEIRVHANLDVGGYAWARYGFVPDSYSWDSVAARARNRVNSGSYTPDIKAQVNLITSIRDPKAIWVLASLKDRNNENIGKKLLLGSDWEGKIDLNDKERYDVLKDYVSSGRARAARV